MLTAMALALVGLMSTPSYAYAANAGDSGYAQELLSDGEGGTLGWVLIAINTVLAVVGIALDLIDLNRFSKFTLVLYAAMGWLILPALKTVVQVLPMAGVLLLASGGVAYTLGIAFYKSKKHYMHFIWHLFVLAGSVLQYFCVLLYCV